MDRIQQENERLSFVVAIVDDTTRDIIKLIRELEPSCFLTGSSRWGNTSPDDIDITVACSCDAMLLYLRERMPTRRITTDHSGSVGSYRITVDEIQTSINLICLSVKDSVYWRFATDAMARLPYISNKAARGATFATLCAVARIAFNDQRHLRSDQFGDDVLA